MVKWTIEKVKKYVEENTEAKLISNEYKGQNEPLKFECKCGEQFERTWKIFLRGSYNCKKCSWEKINKNKKYTIEKINKFVNENSTSKLISKEYDNCKENLKFKCECGNVFETPFDNFKNGNKRKCNECSIEDGRICKDGKLRPIGNIIMKTNNQFLKELKEKRQDEFVPLEEYKGARVPIKVKHNKCGNVWYVTPDKLLNRQDNCPYCTHIGRNSKGSQKVEEYLQENNIEYVKEKSFEGLKGVKMQNNLRFDFYLPLLNICIEYDGEQHHKEIELFGGKEAYEVQQRNDSIKNAYCEKHNIRLIRIPYYDLKNIENLLNMSIMSQACQSV